MSAHSISKKNNWLSVVNYTDPSKPVELMIYDQIGKDFWTGEGIESNEFREALDAIPQDKEILVRIHTPGGSVSSGVNIFDLLEMRHDKVTTRIEGAAHSIGSVIALAGKHRAAVENMEALIHQPYTFGGPLNSTEAEELADWLRFYDQKISSIYAKKTGKTVEEWQAIMKGPKGKGTMLNGTMAKELGLIDELKPAADFKAFADNPAIAQFKAAAAKTDPSNASDNQPLTAAAAPISEPKEGEEQTAGLPPAQPKEKQSMSEPNNTPAPAAQPAASPANAPVALSPETVAAIADAIAASANKPADNAMPPKVVVVGDAYDKMVEAKPGAERRDVIVAQWNDIQTAALKREVYNINTVAAALTTNLLSDTVITTLGVKLAALRALFIEIMPDAVKPKATIEVPIVTSGATMLTSPTDWESGDSVISNVEVTMYEYAQAFHVTNAQLQSGTQIAWLVEKNARRFAEQLMDVILTPVTEAIYGASVATVAAAAFGPSDLPIVRAGAKNFARKNLVLDGDYFARLIPTSTDNLPVGDGAGQFGFDGIWENNQWPAAVGNIRGFACSPEALVIAAGLPIQPPGFGTAFAQVGSATIPGLNISVQTSSWVKPGTRVQWNAFDLMLGVEQADTSALVSIKTA